MKLYKNICHKIRLKEKTIGIEKEYINQNDVNQNENGTKRQSISWQSLLLLLKVRMVMSVTIKVTILINRLMLTSIVNWS